ncbi:hypothetical protein DM860_001991 [Cuscuta australis]|uniref:Dof-type domain-containing protein n=1 Tax=Cuscuta australis TaxID=267555 RepID=A0A328DWW5_9ASTE|nr:hypothetical protein DM860_001991 [Cuscuta australis]
MAEVQESRNTQGIKLFGATIITVVKEKKSNKTNDDPAADHKRPDKAIPCPRCKSMETKFCYFNNYNVNQPRHFCKGCQRYWTAGGALRNVPVGAGRRKNKPPCPMMMSAFSPEGCFYDAASGLLHHIEFDEAAAVRQWRVAQQGRFEELLPAKRSKISATN